MNKLSFNKILIAALVCGNIAFAAYALHQHKERLKAETSVTDTRKTVNQAAVIIDRYIDSSNRKHIVLNASGNTLPATWYKDGTAISGGLVDTVAAALKIAKKQIQEITQTASLVQAEKLKALKKYDSLQRVTYYYKDRYLQLAYRPAKPGDTVDNGQFDFKYNDSLNVVQYWKKNWFLGSKKSYIDIYSNDPRTTVNGVKRLVVKQNEPAFGLRVQAVSNYSFSRNSLNIGPGLQFDFKRFSLVGTYYYDFDAAVFRPSIGARYDLIRF